jgi:hypothetical protein
MDKLLESKFKLKGARPPPPAFTATTAPTAASDHMSTPNCLPPVYKRSPVSSQTSSTNDTESTYVASNQSQESGECEREPSRETQDEVSSLHSHEQELEVGDQEHQGHGDDEKEAPEQHDRHIHDDQAATQELAIVAYHIQPGGKVVHVNVF